jgi:signal peptide peptidase SppA
MTSRPSGRKRKKANKKANWLVRLLRGKRSFVTHVRLKGAIGMVNPVSPGVSFAGVEKMLDQAFAIPGTSAVAVSINSPGGSPVQATMIYERIRQLAEENEVKVLVFCEDVAASGGYLLALAGDEVFADRSSIIGSIGVISAGFGFNTAIKKLGVERRVYTAGKNKSVLDPFLPERKDDVAHLKSLQEDVHEAFKDIVRKRREGRLKEDESKLFSGLFWAGERAQALGLVDGIGTMHAVLRDRFGEDVIIKTIEPQRGFSLRRFITRGGASLDGGLEDAGRAAGQAATAAVLSLAEERALWSRYGL